MAVLDPPYHKGLAEKAMAQLVEFGWLKPGAVVMVERGSDENAFAPAGFEVLDARDYGAARVHFLRAG
jgi:16S rRNA (guanine966-N2)-methyltransferase